MAAGMTTFEVALVGAGQRHEYIAFVSDGQGGRLAEHPFTWRSDNVALWEDLNTLAKAARAGQQADLAPTVSLGQRLFEAALGGEVGAAWARQRQAAGRAGLRLVLRPDPDSARPLLNLPWEYVHDGREFLTLNRRTPVSRLPWGVQPETRPPLDEALRLLVVIAAPQNLNQNEILNTSREEELILAATRGARQAGRLSIEWTPNATPETLKAYLRKFNPHLLHFVGHGVFDPRQDAGLLQMETADGQSQMVTSGDFARWLVDEGDALRFVFLSACQSALAPKTSGMTDVATSLAQAGIPGVVAMQFSVLNTSAMTLGYELYKGMVSGAPIDEAMTTARRALGDSSPNRVDFGVAVLTLADPACLQVTAPPAAPRDAVADLTGLEKAQAFVGRRAELRELQTRLDPQTGTWRAAVIHGLGGMGKTALAVRLAERMASRFDGIKALRMTPTTTAQSVLNDIAAFLAVHAVELGTSVVDPFLRAKDADVPLDAKVGLLAEVLKQPRLLLIFDNYEDVLPHGTTVSRAAQEAHGAEGTEPVREPLDPALASLVAGLVGSVAGPSRFLFTSRVDFEPLDPARALGAIGHVDLGEMGFRDAVYLMETLPPLDRLPVAVAEAGDGPRPLSMRDVHRRVGGHPYTLGLLARHAVRSSVETVLADLADVRREAMEFTLLDRAAATLSQRARMLLQRATVYEEPVARRGLAYLMGDEQDAMPKVEAEVAELLGWGLLTRTEGSGEYLVPALVREWAREGLAPEERRRLLRRAGWYWLGVGVESSSLVPYLRAWHYLYRAEEHEAASDIAQLVLPYLEQWGEWEVALQLLDASVVSLQGIDRVIAVANRGRIYQDLGRWQEARQDFELVLADFEELGDRRGIAGVLHNLGVLHQHQGDYERALQCLELSLVIEQELGNVAGIARTVHQLGALHAHQGHYEQAGQYTEQALASFQQLNDYVGVARSLHNLGGLHQHRGDYERARESFEQALVLKEQVVDRSTMANSLHNLGSLFLLQDNHEQALQHYEQAILVQQQLGDRAAIAVSLQNLGALHQIQRHYERARQCYEQSLLINQELGNRAVIATSLYNLGSVFHDEGNYGQAQEYYEQSLAIEEELGNRSAVATSLSKLGSVYFWQGNYRQAQECHEQSLAIEEELGDRRAVASSLHNLGTLHQLQSNYERARECYERALTIQREIGDRSGAASNLREQGLAYQVQGNYERAREYYEGSLTIELELDDLTGIGMSLQLLGQLAELEGRDTEAARLLDLWLGVHAASVEVDEGSDVRPQVMTEEAFARQVAARTVAVMAGTPEDKGAWWRQLGEIEGQVRAQGADDAAAFAHALRRVVEGAKPERLTSDIPEALRGVWEELVVRGLAAG